MNRLGGILVRIATDLEQLEVPWALVGAMAMTARAIARATADVDIAVSVRPDSRVEVLVRTLFDRGYQQHSVLERKTVRQIRGIRLICPGYTSEGGLVDLLSAVCGIEPEIIRAAEELEVLRGLTVPVATTGHLLAMKVLAWRDQDRADVNHLLAAASPADLTQAFDALDLISRRGFDGGVDLIPRFQLALARFERGEI
ncbi:MAG: nucleotidyl transferase AbiEii/AbiGii toxin family protein [Acidobacteria bacterium]|nr:nucleotidyl transferase AbiEii/AbiGii toxin family protein [Acidobacteriota bacterium]